MKISIAEVLLSEYKIWIEPGSRAEFFDGPVPVAVQGVGIAQVVMRPRFGRGFEHRVGPEQKSVLVELVPLVCEEAQRQD
jgi:hypothetical protein